MAGFYKWSVTNIEVHSIDERVVCYYFNSKGDKIAVSTLNVDEAEQYAKLLQEAVEQCKESEYYQE